MTMNIHKILKIIIKMNQNTLEQRELIFITIATYAFTSTYGLQALIFIIVILNNFKYLIGL